MIIDRQILFTQKIVDNMKGRDRSVMRDAMEQFAEPTRALVRKAVALSTIREVKIDDYIN